MTLVKIITPENKKIAPLAEEFNRLTHKIEELKTRINAKEAEMDKCLTLWADAGSKEFRKLQQFRYDFVSLLFEYHESRILKSKTDQEILIQLIIMHITQIEHNSQIFEIPGFEEFRTKVFKSKGFDMDDDLIDEQCSELEGYFEEMGIEADFDIRKWLKEGANPNEFSDRLKEQIRSKQMEDKDEQPKVKRKKSNSKKEIAKELISKSLTELYRQLARVFHPDLESDPEQKKIKEQLMTDLNLAYEAKNIHSMLQMEIKWLESSSDRLGKLPEEKLKVYVNSLKEQIKILHSDLQQVPYQRKYAILQQLAAPLACYSVNSYRNILKEFQNEAKALSDSLHLFKLNGNKQLESLINEFKDLEAMNIY